MGVARRSWALMCVGLVALVAALAPASGWAGPRPKLLLRSATPLRTDGWRFAAYSQDGSHLVIRDTVTKRQRKLPLGVGCGVEDGARGFFLLNCSTPAGDATPYVLRAGSGALVQPPGEGKNYFPSSDYFFAVGTQWLAGVNAGSGRVVSEYINWHTGRIVGTHDEGGDPTVPRDLNSASLAALGPTGRYAVFQRLGAMTVTQGEQLSDPLVLRVRGHRRVILDQCESVCSSVTLGPKVVTWASARAHAYVIKTHRRFAWKFGGTLAHNVAVQQVAKTIYVNVGNPSRGFRVFAIAMPR